MTAWRNLNAVFTIIFFAITRHGHTFQTMVSLLPVPDPILTALLFSAEATAGLPALHILS